jgi:hypothetical protein
MSTLCHEFSHVMGVSHDFSISNAVMNPQRNLATVYYPMTDDVKGAKAVNW